MRIAAGLSGRGRERTVDARDGPGSVQKDEHFRPAVPQEHDRNPGGGSKVSLRQNRPTADFAEAILALFPDPGTRTPDPNPWL